MTRVRIFAVVGASAAALVLILGAMPASAITSVPKGAVGADISWPQCNGTFTAKPSGAKFGIVGVNDGRPGTTNPCYAAQLAWEASINSNVAPVQVYLNTADPGNTVSDWPSGGFLWLTPYGFCESVKSRGHLVGADSQACAYVYGEQQATYALRVINSSAAPSKFWLDVETGNTWQYNRTQDMNEAVLDGIVATLPRGEVGVYSTHYQWTKIVGGLDNYSKNSLLPLDEWIPTGSNSATQADCTNSKFYPTFTNGTLDFIQYTTNYDYDIACA